MPEIMAPVGVVTHYVVDHEELRPEEEVIEGVSIQKIGMVRDSEGSENFRNFVTQMRMFPSVISAWKNVNNEVHNIENSAEN